MESVKCLLPLLFLQTVTQFHIMADFVDSMLTPSVYDRRVRPFRDSGKPVKVSVDMFLNSISSIDEVNMDYTLNIFLRQRWVDDRLRFSSPNETVTLNYNLFDQLWVPDLFVKNEKKATFHEITVPNRLLTLSPDGTVYYSQRLSLTLICNMNLEKFPMDNQTCSIQLESYGYTTRDIVFEWRDIGRAVQVTEDLSLPEFKLVDTNVGDCTTTYITGSFSCQFATLILVRQFQYYLIQTFIPTILIVALSWVSFWIDIHAVPARISLGLLTVLTMTTQSATISSRLPRVSYIKAIDIWMTACLVFVFGGLVEYSVVNVLARTKPLDKDAEETSKESASENTPPTSGLENDSDVVDPGTLSIKVHEEDSTIDGANNGSTVRQRKPATSTKGTVPQAAPKKKKNSLRERLRHNPALRLDIASRFLFPGIFLVFNIVYWSYFQVPDLEPKYAVDDA